MADLTFIKPLLKRRGIKIKDFCNEIGVTVQGFAKLMRSNSTKIYTLELIAEKLNIPVASFFRNQMVNANCMDVPFVPVYEQARYVESLGDHEYIERLPYMPIVVDHTFVGNYRIFEVKGDSMYDNSIRSLLNGDKILCREVRRKFWSSQLHINDWYFVIVNHTDCITVKQIVAHDVERGIITCHPLNHLFEDFDMKMDDVMELYNVVSIVDRKIRI